MSNQFYEYIAELLLTYFQESGIKAGDRFYLQLDKPQDVGLLASAFRDTADSLRFVYKHEYGDLYETFAAQINNVQLVVAYTSENVKPDFLVTLRNQVSDQSGIWQGTALLSIVHEQLDSIQGGSSDLQKLGMPLHPDSLVKKLRNQIENSTLSRTDQIVLLDNMEIILQERAYQQVTFFDFEEVFRVLKKGHIADEDYRKLGLFRDSDLETFKGNSLKERLELNREFFEYVQRVHDFGLEEDELGKKFSTSGTSKLKGETWSELSFSEVYKFNQELLEMKRKTSVEIKDIAVKDFEFWDRPEKETTAGQRRRQVIIFNPAQQEEIHLNVSFTFKGGDSKSLSDKFLSIPKQFRDQVTPSVGRSNLGLTIKSRQNQPTFVRVVYRHEHRSSLGADLSIAILPIEPRLLDSHRTNYVVDTEHRVIALQYDGDELSFGTGYEKRTTEVFVNNSTVPLHASECLLVVPLPDAFNDKEELQFNLHVTDMGSVIPVLLKNEVPESVPISGARIEKLKREHAISFEWNRATNKLTFGNRQFYLSSEYKALFEWENKWVEDGIQCAQLDSEVLLPKDLVLSDEIREAYSRFLTYFKTKRGIPSLTCYEADLIQRATEYVSTYCEEIKRFAEGHEAGQRGRDLFKLGTLFAGDVIYFTPFHPLIVAYQIQLNSMLSNEEIDNSILSRLKPDSLVPFIYDDSDNLFKPDGQHDLSGWVSYKPVNEVTVSDADKYLAKVVEDKLHQFREHFGYLFSKQSRAPLKISLINIENDHEVLRGIITWMMKSIETLGTEAIHPVEVMLYRETSAESAFDYFSRIESVSELESAFNIRFSSENEPQDLLRAIRSNLFYYKQSSSDGFSYAHITFYKMHAQEKDAVQPMQDMTTGIALEGLYSSVPSMRSEENYRSGFGIRAYTVDGQALLVEVAYLMNELAANLRNGGHDSYRKGEAIFSRTTTADEKTLDEIFASSYWVTFVDPTVDLEFFNSYGKDIVVIHYSDQYSSSTRYDAITVTNKSEQYYAVIREYLKSKSVESQPEGIVNAIKAFNTFNGEWLLRIIGSKGHYSREKLSIVSAIKYSLAYFDHADILWVPISLEEILRVAGAVSLNKSEGIFTAKNLGVKGSHSDDLLLIGLEHSSGTYKLHFYPIEVKIGANKNDVIDKARIQVKKTKALIMETLSDSEKKFTARFYRNFFVQLLISNASKISQAGIWPGKNYALSDEIIEALLKDKFVLSRSAESYIGQGAILSFQRDAILRSSYLEDGITYVNLPEHDGYSGLTQSMQDIRDWLQDKNSDFIKEKLLFRCYVPGPEPSTEISAPSVGEYQPKDQTGHKQQVAEGTPEYKSVDISPQIEDVLPEIENTVPEIEEDIVPEVEETVPRVEDLEPEVEDLEPEVEDLEPEVEDLEPEVEDLEPEAEDMIPEPDPDGDSDKLEPVGANQWRILLGRVENSNRQVYWEYGNEDLPNRHLLISGKSGQGKTYFMQCLLMEMSKLGISSIVVDYTEGFLPNQLEPEFIECLGSKLTQKIVIRDQFPINPFKNNVRDIGGITLPESNTDVAERIKTVFGAVYRSLGIQQLNAIYEAVHTGLDRYGEHMNLPKLRELFEEDGSNYAKTALSQIRPFIDRNPFTNQVAMDWADVLKADGQVFVIQLTGYPRDVQLIISEFILWDLWNYAIRFGDKTQPIPVILDEAQNLDHTEKSPSARILTEGRKFGLSAWYATQFLKAQLNTDELARLQNASEKVFFAQTEQELSYIAGTLANDSAERKSWEAKLMSLKKGQCIVQGPLLKETGDLSTPHTAVVNITPLAERLNHK